ncbi:alkaline shock response membrane anchor protein AmaP [Amycolatopsis sacchari]|uniref:alkaline shock response membrane anchor protein AmaP n=1 Tax=Amycolatopsis sacchari TaxID=115433 RepID=UPI003D7449A2
MPSLNRPARLNRTLLTLSGLVLLAAGGFALATHFRLLTVLDPDAPLVPGTALPPSWGLYVTAAAGIVVALLALRWLLAQLATTPKHTTWRFEQDPDTGRTELAANTAIAPLLAEIQTYPGVAAARGTLAGQQDAPTLALVITADQDGDPAAIRRQLDTVGVPRLREALDLHTLSTTVEFRFHARTRNRIQ